MKKVNWVLFTIFLLVNSCQKPETINSADSSTSSGELMQDDALLIANNFGALFNIGNDKKKSTSNARTGILEKTVKKIKTFKDSLQTALYYVITYNEGGFVIVSAEKRARPILAFSDIHDFPVDREFPAGVKEIMDSYVASIKELRSRNEAPDPSIRAEWERLENTTAITKLIDGGKDAGGRVWINLWIRDARTLKST